MNKKEKEKKEKAPVNPDELTGDENSPAAEEAPAAAEAENSEEQTIRLEEAMARADEYLALAQRVQADFENYRRRNETVRSSAYAEGKQDAAAAMLPVLDNLERAAEASSSSGDEAIISGVSLVLKQMQDIYSKMNVTVINRQGEKFDPNLENAVLQGAPEDGEPGTVCQVLQKGYIMGDKVLRHAMVKVVPE